MLDDGALAISLPALELATFRPPGSIFSARDLAAAELSPELNIAVELVTGICRESGFEPTFVARPEILPTARAARGSLSVSAAPKITWR